MRTNGKWTMRAVLILLSGIAAIAVAQEYEISRHTVDGGGVMQSTGGEFELSGTIGQPDASIMVGGEYDLAGGFWFPLAPGDCNTDGGVNLFDHGDWTPCLSGPEGGMLRRDCPCFDLDHDNDVDLLDAAEFQKSFMGS